MKGYRTGVGIVFGVALGLVFGQMLFDNWWLGPMIAAAAAGLIIGAVVDLLATYADPGERTKQATGRTT